MMPTKHSELSFELYYKDGEIIRPLTEIQDISSADLVPEDEMPLVDELLGAMKTTFEVPVEFTGSYHGMTIDVKIERKDMRKMKNDIRHWFGHVKREERRKKRRKEKERRAALKAGKTEGRA